MYLSKSNKCICPNCTMYLFKLKNVFIKIYKCIWTNKCIILNAAWPSFTTYTMYLSKLRNAFVQIKQMYMSKWQNVFVQTAKCISQNWQMYLDKKIHHHERSLTFIHHPHNVFVQIRTCICPNQTNVQIKTCICPN